MYIGIPVAGGQAGMSLDRTEEVRFYTDDHGQVLRSRSENVAGGFEALLALLERESVDAVLCGPLSAEERGALAAAGLLLAPARPGLPGDALKEYLSVTVACDPSNTCTYCKHRSTCAVREE